MTRRAGQCAHADRDRAAEVAAFASDPDNAVLYFDGCPSHEALMPRLRMLMAHAGVDAPLELKHVESDDAAQRERFLGSPTLRVDGEDVDPTAGERTDFGMKCLLYPSPDGLSGTVPDEFVVAALTRALGGRAMRRSADASDADGFDAFARAMTTSARATASSAGTPSSAEAD